MCVLAEELCVCRVGTVYDIKGNKVVCVEMQGREKELQDWGMGRWRG